MTFWGLRDSKGPILMHQAHLVQMTLTQRGGLWTFSANLALQILEDQLLSYLNLWGQIMPTSLLLHRKPFLFCKYFFSFLGNHIRFLFGTSKAGKTPRYCYCTFQSEKRRKYCHTSYDIFPIPRQCDWNNSHVAQVIWIVKFPVEECRIELDW